MYLSQPSRGLGLTNAQTVQVVQAGTPIIGSVVTGAAAASASASIAAGGTGLILGMAPALAVPIIGAAIVGITILATLLIKNSGCGQTCIETSQWANQAEALLQNNITTYFAQTAPRSASQQAAALANFDAIWARLVALCSPPATGNAGKKCISDRQAGSCAYTQPANKVPPWGTPAAGQCWNWFSGYRDPIANDSDVYDDSVGAAVSNAAAAASSALSSSASGSGLSAGVLAALAAAVLVVWGMTQS
jgi:hypothetical protein